MQQRNMWAVGFLSFAAIATILAGMFQALSGLVAIFENEFYVLSRNYFLEFDVTTWGWIHLLLGIVVVFAGVMLLTGALWARVVAITIAAISAFANFTFIPYYPIWSLIIIALDVAVIWALTVHGHELSK